MAYVTPCGSGQKRRSLADQTIAESICELFDSSSQKQPVEASQGVVSGPVACPKSAERPTLGSEPTALFKEAKRREPP